MPTTETQSIHRAIAILDCFHESQPELGVREIARQLELHPSTVGRMLTTLTSLGVLVQDKETHRYRMGSKVLKWGAVYMGNVDLRLIARPYMQELRKTTEETISLDILDGSSRLCVERIESPQQLRWVKKLGERMPFYASASGRVLLSFMAPGERSAILAAMHFEQLTSNTTTDPKVFEQELDLTRERGYAVSEGERVEGVSCVAAPVFDAGDKIIGAVTISGPSTRFSKKKIQQYGDLLLLTTAQISAAMGKPPSETKDESYLVSEPSLQP
ncbi:MAG TPA: IclR family transcriptional regulator [Anaerolineales bacterium]|nr:IclR family transcriptional regulator [Anaerolineales bacterium]